MCDNVTSWQQVDLRSNTGQEHSELCGPPLIPAGRCLETVSSSVPPHWTWTDFPSTAWSISTLSDNHSIYHGNIVRKGDWPGQWRSCPSAWGDIWRNKCWSSCWAGRGRTSRRGSSDWGRSCRLTCPRRWSLWSWWWWGTAWREGRGWWPAWRGDGWRWAGSARTSRTRATGKPKFITSSVISSLFKER